KALQENGLENNTIVIFTSDHGYHLGEHDFWAKVSLLDQSSGVPLIISVPGEKPAVCDSFVELLDLYPTTAKLCGLEVPDRLQGKDISPMLKDPEYEVRDAAFSVAPMRKGFLLRDKNYSFIQYGENAENGIELFDIKSDPGQFANLAVKEEKQSLVDSYRKKMTAKLQAIRNNDL
ncbi:MAG: sulfatase-like hydrolase/transferase, partial [Verrucomicrobiales bacterium]|nr:sulfatase-like hydrolase/transferase [Verrucomicrobiales bacterium]